MNDVFDILTTPMVALAAACLGLGAAVWAGYLFGKANRTANHNNDLSVEIVKSYRKIKSGARRVRGWRWKARANGRACGMGQRDFKNFDDCGKHVRAILNVNPARVKINLD